MLDHKIDARIEQRGADECWPWTGYRLPKGYGTFSRRVAGKHTTIYAHRFVYERRHGPIPDWLEIDHTCNHPWCCNPAHLEAKTGLENNRRSQSVSAQYRLRTHCKNGHEFTPENTRPGPRNSRRCRACDREAKQRIRHGQADHEGPQRSA